VRRADCPACHGTRWHKNTRKADMCPLAYERKLDRAIEWYWNLSGFEYNKRLLKSRRHKALKRIAEREQRRATEETA
jgi:hypothetical protein